jgi:hypothetical protein
MKMKFEKKGMLAPFTIFTSLFTGLGFPLLGSLAALDLGVIDELYLEGLILVIIGGFLAQWILAHTIHDLYHIDLEKRITFSKKTLKLLLVISFILLLCIAIYLTIQCGWPVFVFSVIGGIVSLYAEGLLHHESQMAIGAMFLVIGAFYVQGKTLNLEIIIWLQILSLALFSFLSQFGWLLIYRLDDYKYNESRKNRFILVTKSALIFLIIYLLLKITY